MLVLIPDEVVSSSITQLRRCNELLLTLNQEDITWLFHDKQLGSAAITLCFGKSPFIEVVTSQNAPAARSQIAIRSSSAKLPSSKWVVPHRRWPRSCASEFDEIRPKTFVR